MSFGRLKSRFSVVSMTVALIVALPSVLTSPDGSAGAESVPWKGAETLSPVTLGADPVRCGPAPPNVFAVFAGSGIDSKAGVFEVQVSGCMNLDTLRLFNLEATDTFVGTGDSIVVAPGEFTLSLDESTCVATNARPVSFTVTGAREGSRPPPARARTTWR